VGANRDARLRRRDARRRDPRDVRAAGTALPGEPPPFALTPAFGRDAEKQAQWRAFLARARLRDAPGDLATVVERIGALVLPPATAGRGDALRATWTPGVGWAPDAG
jgi:hypothetical protein